MGLMSSALERRATKKDEAYFIRGLTAANSATGIHVDEESALAVTAVFACAGILADSIAQLPLRLLRRHDRGRALAREHHLYPLITEAPNPEMTIVEYFNCLMVHLALWGNHYSSLVIDGAGRVKEIWPLRPDRVRIERRGPKKKDLVYIVQVPPDGEERVLMAWEVLHLRGLTIDGIMGKSPITEAREAIALALAAERASAAFYGNNAQPLGVLEFPGKLSEPAAKRMRESWDKQHRGLERMHRIAILEEGLSYKAVGIPPKDAEFVMSRKFQVAETARLFRIPPHMIGDVERSTSWGTGIAEMGIGFLTYTLMPWIARLEVGMRKLLPVRDRTDHYLKFTVQAFERGDFKSRMEGYQIGRGMGVYNSDDIRELEDLDPLPEGQGGDLYLAPVNYWPLGALADISGPDDDGGARDVRAQRRALAQRAAAHRWRLRRSFRPLLQEAAARVVRREVHDVRTAARNMLRARDLGEFQRWIETFYRDDHRKFVRERLAPIFASYGSEVAAAAAAEIGYTAEYDVERFVARYAENCAEGYVARSLGALRHAIQEAPLHDREPLEAIEELVGEWDGQRADKIALQETVKFESALARAIFLTAGFKTMWARFGNETCEYCQALDGKTIGAAGVFIAAGEEFTPDPSTVEPLCPTADVRHPPAHDECSCGIIATT